MSTTKNTLKQTKHQTKSQFVNKLLGHVIKDAAIKVFLNPKKRERSRRGNKSFSEGSFSKIWIKPTPLHN